MYCHANSTEVQECWTKDGGSDASPVPQGSAAHRDSWMARGKYLQEKVTTSGALDGHNFGENHGGESGPIKTRSKGFKLHCCHSIALTAMYPTAIPIMAVKIMNPMI